MKTPYHRSGTHLLEDQNGVMKQYRRVRKHYWYKDGFYEPSASGWRKEEYYERIAEGWQSLHVWTLVAR